MKKTIRWSLVPLAFILGLLALAPACAASSTVTATVTAASTATIVVTKTAATVTVTPSGGSGVFASNGQRIFLTASSSSGQPIYGEGYMMYSRYVSCSECHGQDGHGGPINMMMFQLKAPDITWTALTDPKQYNPPYTDSSLSRAITQGFDSSGQFLSVYMPRWQMAASDLNDLIAFIKTLK